MIEKITKGSFWRARLIELSVALVVVYVSINLIEYREALSRAAVPASDWFVLREIYVPDHETGQNPSIIYDRTIVENHRGFWVAEAQRIDVESDSGVFENACTGSGISDYDVDEGFLAGSVKWDWFFGRPCAIAPGVYRINLTRDMSRPGYPIKQTRSVSNTFTVYPNGGLPRR